MGKPTGFMEIERSDRTYEPAEARVKHWKEFVVPLPEASVRTQASRCMDCGIPYCHNGCPVNNQIPDWNDLVYTGDWQTAIANLHSTNNFPEVTGRVCPAPCEASCTLNIDDTPVTIKTIEYSIAERAFAEGWVTPQPSATKTGKSVAIIARSGWSRAAQQLARAGHDVHVYEKNARPGGLLTYGIPDFKLEKTVIARRQKQMEAEGVTFHCNTEVGKTISVKEIEAKHDAVLFAMGSEEPFDLFAKSPGRDLDGLHYAMDFLGQQNRRVAGERSRPAPRKSSRPAKTSSSSVAATRLRLHRNLVPSGCQERDPARNHAEAAGEGEQGSLLAQLALEASHFFVAGRRRNGRVLRLDDGLLGRRREGEEASLRAGGFEAPAHSRHRRDPRCRPRALRHGLRWSPRSGSPLRTRHHAP